MVDTRKVILVSQEGFRNDSMHKMCAFNSVFDEDYPAITTSSRLR